MIEWLKDMVRPIWLTDPQLGRMRYLRDTGTWEAWTEFPAVGRDVEVLLSGDVTGPTDDQRVFLQELKARYESIFTAVKSNLVEATSADALNAAAVEFTLVVVDLPAEVTDEMSWELCYETEPKARFLAIRMKGWVPTNVSEEC
jgi:hypothetical protein